MSTYTFTCARVPVHLVLKHRRIKTSVLTHTMDEKCSYSQKTQRIPLGFHLLKKINFDCHALMFVFYPGLPHMQYHDGSSSQLEEKYVSSKCR